jgi:hypothetical protein
MLLKPVMLNPSEQFGAPLCNFLFILLKTVSRPLPSFCPGVSSSQQTLAKVDLREREAQRIHNCFVLRDTLDFRKLY